MRPGWLCCSSFLRSLCLASLCVACANDPVGDPVPIISDLTCETNLENPDAAPQDQTFGAEFDFRYLDNDADLDDDGGAIQWWVDDKQQSDLALDKQDLAEAGTLVLSISHLLPFSKYQVRLMVVDAAGNSSNELLALVDTDQVTCAQVESF